MADPPTWIVLGRHDGAPVAALLEASGEERERVPLADRELATWVAGIEASVAPRWVWSDATPWYTRLLAAGWPVGPCHDLRLCHAILRDSALAEGADALRAATEWDASAVVEAPEAETLFTLDAAERSSGAPDGLSEALAEFARQRTALATATDPGRLRL